MAHDHNYEFLILLIVLTVISPNIQGVSSSNINAVGNSASLRHVCPIHRDLRHHIRECSITLQPGKKFMRQYYWILPATCWGVYMNVCLDDDKKDMWELEAHYLPNRLVYNWPLSGSLVQCHSPHVLFEQEHPPFGQAPQFAPAKVLKFREHAP